MRTAAIVLCGGQSSRMGQAKAWLPFGEELLLPRVVRILREVVPAVVVVAAVGQELPSLPPEVGVVRDTHTAKGPLAGFATGLAAIAHRVDAVYLSGCDAPFVQPAFVSRVFELLQSHATRAVVPTVTGWRHPLAAAYRVDVLREVQAMFAEDRLRMMELLDRVNARELSPEELMSDDPQLLSLRNLNTQDDYHAALALLAAISHETQS